MATRRDKISAHNIYHVLSRGVDKRNIFIDDNDHLRFIHDLFEFNNTKPINNVTYSFRQKSHTQYKDLRGPYIGHNSNTNEPRELLTEVLAFVLMPNHYHLLLKPQYDEGVTKFMRRLNMGYAKYFNEKYERTGALFEGRFKSIAITNNAHFIHIPYYIHLNPLDLHTPTWRERKIKNPEKAFEFVKNYRWSSFPDYIGIKNFPSVTHREFLTNFFNGPNNHEQEVKKWLQDLEWENIQKYALEK